ncbi:MAG: zinc-binding dehydrogenase, partial [Cyclobacteriaceae bacterium]
VAQFAFQFAKAEGASVYVTSGSAAKRKRALSLGAIEAYDYKSADWYKNPWKTKGGFDVVIDSAGGDQINHFIKIMRPGGRVVFYGATNGLPSSIDLYRMFWNQITLQGSTMGNDREFADMIAYVDRHKIVPEVDSVRPFREIEQAIDDMSANRKSGKIVLSLT